MIKKIFCLLSITILIFSCTYKVDNTLKGKTVIKFWHPFSMTSALGKTLQAMIDEFNKQHPQWFIKPEGMGSYSVLKQKLLAAIIAENQPEMALAYQSWITKFYAGKKILVIEDYVNKGELEEIKKDLFEVFIKNCTIDGKIVSMPFNKSMPVLYYNKDMFERFNIKKLPESWDEFIEICKKLTIDTNNDGKIDIYGTITRINLTDFLNFIMQNDGGILSEDGKEILFNKSEAVEALKFFFSWKYIHNIANFYTSGDPYQYQNDFSSGKCAMIIGSCVSRYFMKYSLTFRLGTAPIFGNKKKAVNVYGTDIIIFNKANEEQRKAAWEFIKYFISPENTAKWSVKTAYMPVRKSALNTLILKQEFEKDPELKTTILQLDYGFLEPAFESWLLGRNYLSEEINNAFIDKEIEKKYNEYLKILKKGDEEEIKKEREEMEKVLENRIKIYLDKAAKKTSHWIF